ncbi:hypothetical protein [Burkholderia pseudomallei]|uniref:hypothetical protein n=1 Tax=Burkholderia pseudomallei TaxID=28450 RepID=UPI00130E28C9|nr:hypothetical protein [Burkholderia pseudomallei]
MRRAAGLGAFWVGAVRLIEGRKWLAGGGEWCRYLRRSAEAPKRRSAEAPKRRSAEAPKRRSAEALKYRTKHAPHAPIARTRPREPDPRRATISR